MGRLECRSCGHTWDDDAGRLGVFLIWCRDCYHRYHVAVDPDDAPADSQYDVLDEAPDGCLACGGHLSRDLPPPCDACGSAELRPAD